jgi:hypothetical protein
VYFGENINSVAGQHWQSFATQGYFDEHGVFYNTLVSGPALITLLAVLVSVLSSYSSGMPDAGMLVGVIAPAVKVVAGNCTLRSQHISSCWEGGLFETIQHNP